MTNYNPTFDEFKIMSLCLSLGFKCYAVATSSGNKPQVTLEIQYRNNQPKKSSEPPFDQKYLAYKTFDVYHKFYNKIKDKL